MQLFDYRQLDPTTDQIVREHTAQIRLLVKRTAEDIITIGQRLIEVKFLLGHGRFLAWLATEFHWSERTARNFMNVARSFKSESVADLFTPKTLYLLASPSTPDTARAEVIARAHNGETVTYHDAQAIVNHHRVPMTSNSDEWYTPPPYLEAARLVMGDIDVDPASSELANRTVRAKTYFTKEQDGLCFPWPGRVWLNPPYGKLTADFVARLVESFRSGVTAEAIALVNSYATETGWFRPLWDYTLCFSDHRIHFASGGQPFSRPTSGRIFAYLGPKKAKFACVFRQFGPVVEQVQLD